MSNILTMTKIIKNSMLSVTTSGNILTKIWRKLIYDSNISTNRWNILLKKWETETNMLDPGNAPINLKGNMDRTLASDTLTWPALVTGFAVMLYKDVVFKFILKEGLEYEISNKETAFDQSTLYNLWQKILLNESLSASEWKAKLLDWQTLMASYVTARKRLNLIGNAIKALSSANMTWTSFMKGLSILGYQKITLKVIIKTVPEIEYTIELNVVSEYIET